MSELSLAQKRVKQFRKDLERAREKLKAEQDELYQAQRDLAIADAGHPGAFRDQNEVDELQEKVDHLTSTVKASQSAVNKAEESLDKTKQEVAAIIRKQREEQARAYNDKVLAEGYPALLKKYKKVKAEHIKAMSETDKANKELYEIRRDIRIKRASKITDSELGEMLDKESELKKKYDEKKRVQDELYRRESALKLYVVDAKTKEEKEKDAREAERAAEKEQREAERKARNEASEKKKAEKKQYNKEHPYCERHPTQCKLTKTAYNYAMYGNVKGETDTKAKNTAKKPVPAGKTATAAKSKPKPTTAAKKPSTAKKTAARPKSGRSDGFGFSSPLLTEDKPKRAAPKSASKKTATAKSKTTAKRTASKKTTAKKPAKKKQAKSDTGFSSPFVR